VAGVVEQVGAGVTGLQPGDRVSLHYLLTCGECHYCRTGHEQFCPRGRMIGKHTDGGYAEYIAVPARNAVRLPDEISFEHGAIMMCSSSTSFHALRKARLRPGETVAVFGAGGLGMSAIQLAQIMGALAVYAVDINPAKLALAEHLGAVPVDASQSDPVAELRRLTDGRGVDVAVEVIGLKLTMEQSVRSLAVLGRAVLAGIADKPFEIDSYRDLLGREAEVIGSADHTLWELEVLVEYARQCRLDLSDVVARTVPLEARAINKVMDELEQFGGEVRTVIKP
jgi:propanol-preferring alcohol dehydrogenase